MASKIRFRWTIQHSTLLRKIAFEKRAIEGNNWKNRATQRQLMASNIRFQWMIQHSTLLRKIAFEKRAIEGTHVAAALPLITAPNTLFGGTPPSPLRFLFLPRASPCGGGGVAGGRAVVARGRASPAERMAATWPSASGTVLHIIKLNQYPVQVRFCSGSGKTKFLRYFIMFCDI